MTELLLKPFYHRGQDRLGLFFDHNAALQATVKRMPAARWSQTHKCWHVPLSVDAYTEIKKALQHKASITATPLREYLHKKKQVMNTVAKPLATKKSITLLPAQPTAWQLSPPNLHALQIFVQQLKLKAYSTSTIKTYRNEFLQLLQLLKTKPVDTLTPDDLKRYMVHIMEKEGVSENTAHSRLNALKFYFEQVLGREKFFWEIPRPKKAMQLPKLLNEVELGKLFNALENKKHKAILFTTYSAGLRVSEVASLRISDIDSGRMQILISRGKGKKDRIVNLSPVLLDILRQYMKTYSPRPKIYLFESDQTGEAYPVRTIQQIFTTAKRKAGIRKEVGIHSLRHSFATHLLDKGTDIRYIKDLLGHFNIKTTERYLHVSKKSLVNIVSPLDDLWLKGNLEW